MSRFRVIRVRLDRRKSRVYELSAEQLEELEHRKAERNMGSVTRGSRGMGIPEKMQRLMGE